MDSNLTNSRHTDANLKTMQQAVILGIGALRLEWEQRTQKQKTQSYKGPNIQRTQSYKGPKI